MAEKGVLVEKSQQSDWEQLEALYPLAFPEEDLLPVVRQLLPDASVLSFVAKNGEGKVCGHIMFTLCDVETATANPRIAMLAPLGVLPEFQQQGIGSALVRKGLDYLAKKTSCELVVVLGDPKYYGRFGFVGSCTSIEPPYPLSPAYQTGWQSLSLITTEGDTEAAIRGKLSLPKAWMDPSLWQ